YVVAGVAYFASIYGAGETHLHLNDGTFSLSAPFLWTLIRSGVGLLWVWGTVVLLFSATRTLKPRLPLMVTGLVWIPVALLPYSFLTYMSRFPSRHTYLASVGLALIAAGGFMALRQTWAATRRAWLVPLIAIVSLVQEGGYVWMVQQARY